MWRCSANNPDFLSRGPGFSNNNTGEYQVGTRIQQTAVPFLIIVIYTLGWAIGRSFTPLRSSVGDIFNFPFGVVWDTGANLALFFYRNACACGPYLHGPPGIEAKRLGQRTAVYGGTETLVRAVPKGTSPWSPRY